MRIKDTVKYKFFNWFRNVFLDPLKYDHFHHQFEELNNQLKDFTTTELEGYKIMNTWTKNPDMPNFSYANSVANAIQVLQDCRNKYMAVVNKLWLGLSEGEHLLKEMVQVNITARAMLNNIRYAHKDGQPTQDTSRDTTQRDQGTSTQVQQVPTPGN